MDLSNEGIRIYGTNTVMTQHALRSCGYLRSALHGASLTEIVSALIGKIEAEKLDFDAIAVRGTSGLLVGPMIAAMMNKSLVVVRKPNDGSHSGYEVEGASVASSAHSEPLRYIIVDDLVCSGSTVQTIVNGVMQHNEGRALCVAMFTYAQQNNGPIYGFRYPFPIVDLVMSRLEARKEHTN